MAAQVWSKGFSREADNDGLVRVKIVDEYLANESADIRAKCSQRFMSEPAYRAVKKWPNALAREKAERNMSSRNWVIPGQGFMLDAIEYKVVQNEPAKDFNSSPEQQKKAAQTWTQQGIFTETHPAGPASCTDWNPAKGTPEYWLAFTKDKVFRLKNPDKQPEVPFS